MLKNGGGYEVDILDLDKPIIDLLKRNHIHTLHELIDNFNFINKKGIGTTKGKKIRIAFAVWYAEQLSDDEQIDFLLDIIRINEEKEWEKHKETKGQQAKENSQRS